MVMRRGFIASGISRSKFDFQQTVLERCALHLDIIREVELPLEGPGGDPTIEIFVLCLTRLAYLQW